MARQKTWIKHPELPDDCWNLIFNRLGRHYRFEDVSLVCKHLYFVTSRLKTSLTIYDPAILKYCNLYKFFKRFCNLVRIDFKCFMTEQEFSYVFFEISRSGLEVEEISVWNFISVDVVGRLGLKLNCVRFFSCEFSFVTYEEIVGLARLMPKLEEFDIGLGGSDVSDEGIKVLSGKVKQLRKVNLFKYQSVTDESLYALSNCKFLNEVVVGSFDASSRSLTENGVGFLLRFSKKLRSICLHGIRDCYSSSSVDRRPSTLYTIGNSISYAESLLQLELHYMVVTDELLLSIAKARIPLKKLVLWHCTGFTYSGLASLLRAYQSSMRHIRLGNVWFLTDHFIKDLTMLLSNVTHLEINNSAQLSDQTFFLIVSKCSSLRVLKLEYLSLGRGGNCNLGNTRHYNINSLELGHNLHLSDQSLTSFGFVCPNLKLIELRGCPNITERGVGKFLNSCSKLTDLKLDTCRGSRILGTVLGTSKLNLEVLQISNTWISDAGMALIGRRCPSLLKLEMNFCSEVTMIGVRDVLAGCVKLREINIWRCDKLPSQKVNWMAYVRPSLRRISHPGGDISNEELTMLILRHGCVVHDC